MWALVHGLAGVIWGWEAFKWISGHGEPDTALVGGALAFVTFRAVVAMFEEVAGR